MKKRLLSLVLTLALLMSLLPTVALAAAWDGTSTTEPAMIGGVYQIGTAEELAWFRDHVNAGNYAVDAKLTADIDLNGKNWTAIGGGDGYASTYFGGAFDGDNHTVSNLVVNAAYNHAGLFGYVKGTIKDLQLINADVTSSSLNVGGIAGTIIDGSIENCAFSGTVINGKTSSGYAGGIAGYVGNTSATAPVIKTCVNYGTIQGPYAGGITGYAKYAAIESCYNVGTITGTNPRTGGIAGQIMNSATINNCYSRGSFGAGAVSVGGITGWNGVSMTNCYWLSPDDGQGGGMGTATSCEKIAAPEGLLEKLRGGGTFFVADEDNLNNCYPILSWQTESGEMDTTPSLKITGGSTIYVNSAAGASIATLTVTKSHMDDMDIGDVTWSIEKQGGGDASGIATLQAVENNKDSIIVKSVNGGVATVTATLTADDEPYTASFDVNVIPNISAVTIVNGSEPGAVAVGQTVQAKVSLVGGGEYDYENFPPLTYQWKHRNASIGGSGTTITGQTARDYTISGDLFPAPSDRLLVTVLCDGKPVAEKQEPVESQDYGKLYPIAYAYTMQTDVKDASPLNLPASITAGDITATIVWTSENAAIANDGTVTQPDSGKTSGKLRAKFTYGDASLNRDFNMSVWSAEAVEESANQNTSYLQTAVDALGPWYSMTPVFGADSNVTQMLSDKLSASGHSDITVTVKNVEEIHGDCAIASNGDITYFYADPAESRGLWFGRQNVTFTLEKGGATLDLEAVPVTIYWDVDRVKNEMTQRVLDAVTDTAILASGDSTGSVTQDLTLPKVVNNQLWTQIAWTSSDPGVISISGENQTTADTLFSPYVGEVSRGAADKTVTLTAAFTFQRSNNIIGSEAPLVLYKTFGVTVEALAGDEADTARAELEAKLDAGFAAVGLRDFVTGDELPESGNKYTAAGDIRLPTTADFGVDGKYFPITITSSGPDTLVPPGVANAARVEVFRPPVGEPAKDVTLTVTMSDKANGISASRNFTISVQPLTQGEIDSELALMAQVKANYFDGIKNTNAAENSITANLRPFQEAYLDGSTLTWVYDNADRTGAGIVSVPMDGWYNLQIWRLFKSGNAAVISHETLEVTRQAQAKGVTVESALSSEVYGKYGERYLSDPAAYSGYADLAPLYYQPVSAELIVRGTQNPSSVVPIAETLSVSFTLQSADSTWISKTTFSKLPEGSTVFDLFSKTLNQNGYQYYANGSYIYAVAHPNGTVLEELEEGANSGWMYKVNGTISSKYMAAQPLKNGDQIVVFFTSDYTRESSTGDGGSLGGELPKSEDYTIEPQEDKRYSVTLKKGQSGATRVSLPAVPPGHVVVIVNADGSETVVKKSFLENGTAHFLLEASATIRVVPAEVSFADVAASDWFDKAVSFVTSHQLFNGVSDENFAMTRGMLVTVLYRLEEAAAQDIVSFPDVEAGNWYSQAIVWAAETDIVTGFEDGKFYPDENISRQQLVTILYRYAQHIGLEVSQAAGLNQYTDNAQVDAYAKEAMEWAVAAGLIQGTPEGLLAPNAFATRAETAVILERMVKLIVMQGF